MTLDKKNNIECPKVSIVIPFYNLEEYLAECLDSVLTQDMPDFEIIAVNDGSTDNTPALLEDYAGKDSRIKVVHLANGGIGWARNNGVRKATGEYLMFMDCDDFILPGCFSKLYSYAWSNNADVVIFNHARCQDNTLCKARKKLYPKDKLMNTVTATKFNLIDGDGYVWNKIIRRNLYLEKNISFPEGVIGEDIPVSCLMLLNSKRIFYINDTFYSYRIRATSFSHSLLTSKGTRDIVHVYKCITEEIQRTGCWLELASVFTARYSEVLTGLLRECYARPERYKSPEELEKDKNFLKERFSLLSIKDILFNPHLHLSTKLKAIRLKSGVYKLEKAITNCFK